MEQQTHDLKPWTSARDYAVRICEILQPHTRRVNIAGSIRRRKPRVKDIEIVCLPSLIQPPADALFGPPPPPVISPEFARMAQGLGWVIKGKPEGKYMQIFLTDADMNLDLFLPDEHDYFRQFAIRTGSADYSAKVIAGGWRAKGWCGSDKGLRRISDCVNAANPGEPNKWKCVNQDAERPPAWGSEEEFFDWIGVKWLVPRLRNI